MTAPTTWWERVIASRYWLTPAGWAATNPTPTLQQTDPQEDTSR